MGLLDQIRSGLQGASNSAAGNISAPVDALAWILRKGGLPIPKNPVGGSDWMAEQGLTATPQNYLAGLIGEGAGIAAPMAVAAKAPQVAGGLLSLDDKAMDMARRGVESRMVNGGMVQHAAPYKPWGGPPRPNAAPSMTLEQAQRIVANEDYLPWDQVAAAKKVLGIPEEKAADIWAQMMAARKRP